MECAVRNALHHVGVHERRCRDLSRCEEDATASTEVSGLLAGVPVADLLKVLHARRSPLLDDDPRPAPPPVNGMATSDVSRRLAALRAAPPPSPGTAAPERRIAKVSADVKLRHAVTASALLRVQAYGRLSLSQLGEALTWAPGEPLTVVAIGVGFVVLTQEPSATPTDVLPVRAVTYSTRGRIVLAKGVRHLLGLEPGTQVLACTDGQGRLVLVHLTTVVDAILAYAAGDDTPPAPPDNEEADVV